MLPWSPPAGLVNHSDRPVKGNKTFFDPPPAEIGQILSAHSTLNRAGKPYSLRARLWLMLLGGLLGLTPCAALSVIWANAVERQSVFNVISGSFCLTWVLSPIAASLSWRATKIDHVCSYVGSLGMASCRWTETPTETISRRVFCFRDAAELHTSQTKHYTNWIY